jgi:hypothetical protein
MRCKLVLLTLAASLFGLAATASASAQEKACLMEGSITIAGQKTEIKDCLQNNGIPQEQFKETCGGLSQVAAAVGGTPAKITYLASCPVPAQGSCEGFFGQPMTSVYYKRDAKLLAESKSSCLAQGGKWK